MELPVEPVLMPLVFAVSLALDVVGPLPPTTHTSLKLQQLQQHPAPTQFAQHQQTSAKLGLTLRNLLWPAPQQPQAQRASVLMTASQSPTQLDQTLPWCAAH